MAVGMFASVRAARWPSFAKRFFPDSYDTALIWGKIIEVSSSFVGTPPAPSFVVLQFHDEDESHSTMYRLMTSTISW